MSLVHDWTAHRTGVITLHDVGQTHERYASTWETCYERELDNLETFGALGFVGYPKGLVTGSGLHRHGSFASIISISHCKA